MEFTKFYQALKTSNNNTDFQLVSEAISPCITEAMNSSLTSIPSQEEIKDAAASINADRAPGPDGFSAGFYHSYWDIIGQDITREVKLFL